MQIGVKMTKYPNDRVLLELDTEMTAKIDLLIEKGHEVKILDNLEPQVHGNKEPNYLNPSAELVIGDIADKKTWLKTLSDVDAVVHLAAMVGVGQSMYQIVRYLNANTIGTANLYEVLIRKILWNYSYQ